MPLSSNDRPSSPAFPQSVGVTRDSSGASTSAASVDTSGSIPLPNALKKFQPFQELRSTLRSFTPAEQPGKAQREEEPASEIDDLAKQLPKTLTVSSTGETAAALALTRSENVKSGAATKKGSLETLQRAIELVGQTLGLKQVSSNERHGQAPAGTVSGSSALLAWTNTHVNDLGVASFLELATARLSVETALNDGISALSTNDGIRQAADVLVSWLNGSAPLLLGDLAQSGLLSYATAAGIESDDAGSQLIAKRLEFILVCLENTLRAAADNGAGRAAIATSVAQFYAALATPAIALAAEPSSTADNGTAESGFGGRPGALQTTPQMPGGTSAGSPPNALAVLRALAERNALGASYSSLALLSSDLSQLLAHHQRGLRQLRKARGFLNAVALTESSAGRNLPLGVLLEGGRQTASNLAATEQAALVDVLSLIGNSPGPVLDRFAELAARNGDQSLADLLSDLSGATAGDDSAAQFISLDQDALSGIVSETRAAARLLRAMLLRETSAADALAARLEAFESGRYSLQR